MDFGNDFARNAVIFCVGKSSSSYEDNLKNDILVLCEGPTDDINGSSGCAEQKFTISFSKKIQSFA